MIKMTSIIVLYEKRCFFSCFFGVVCFLLVLARNQTEMTGLAKQPPIQRMAATFIWFWRELDDTDLQERQLTLGV